MNSLSCSTADATSPLRLGPMLPAHLDAVALIEASAYTHPWSRGNFADSLQCGYHARCLVEARGEVLGYMIAMPGVDEMHLLNIAVAPAHQGQGLALYMLRHLVRHAALLKSEWVWLEVRPSNVRARCIYERFGFVPVSVRKGYYPDVSGRREDALVMRRAISAQDALAWQIGGHRALD